MFWQAHLRAHPEFRAGLREMAPQATGTAIWGLMTGVAMVNSDLVDINNIYQKRQEAPRWAVASRQSAVGSRQSGQVWSLRTCCKAEK